MQLFNHHQPAFGLDISGSSFKLMELGRSGKEVKIKAFSEALFPRGLMVNGGMSDEKSFIELLKTNMDKCKFGQLSTKYVALSIPESKSFVRVIQIPQMSDAEAESAVPVEAESFIPLPVDQVYLDWQKIGYSQDKMNILIVASPKDFVDNYLSVFDTAGLKVVSLEVESQSCLRALLSPDKPESALVVDIGTSRTSLIMVEDGNLQFTSTVPIAGHNFTENIAKILGVSLLKAEEVKKKVGIANTADYPNIKTAVLPVLNNLTAEIKSILKFHNEHSSKQAEKILLVGGGALMKNLPEFLSQEFPEFPGLLSEVGNPWNGLPGIKNIKLPADSALTFTTAIGLAMRGMDFTV